MSLSNLPMPARVTFKMSLSSVPMSARVIFILAALLLPLGFGSFGLYVASELLIWGLFAASLNLLLGYTGLPSFGHAVFFGVPAYVFGIVLMQFHSLALACAAALIVVTVVALLVGFFATRTGGTGYIIVTLLSSYAFFTFVQVATKWTGGEDGLYLPKSLSFAALSPWMAYLIIASVTLALFALMRWLVTSNYGLLLLAIRANEKRVATLGYNVNSIKIQVTVLSGVIAGVAGVLYALLARTLSPEIVGPALSTEAVIWVLLGGLQTSLGPFLGAAIFMALKQVFSSTDWHPLVLGLVFIGMVLWAPQGLVSLRTAFRRGHNQVS
jgi:branched-chain amino acid transport system permease protein